MVRVVHRLFSNRNVCYFFVLVLISVLAYLILLGADWTLLNYGEDLQILETTGKGNFSHGWVGIGRLWPLGLADYSVLLLFSETPSVFHHLLFNAFVMAGSVLSLFCFLYLESKNWGVCLFFSIILASVSSFLQIHMSFIYPERFIFFLQTIYMYFWWLGSKKQSLICYSVAWISITYSLFTKEPIFGMVLVIAFVNLFFGWHNLTEKERMFHIAQSVSSLLFAWIYLFIFAKMGMASKSVYASVFESQKNPFSIAIFFLYQEPFLLCMLLLAAVRTYMVLWKSDRRCLFSDSLLFGAVAYVTAYVLLGLSKPYYIFPAIVFSLPSFSYWCGYFLKKRKDISYFIMISCFISVIPSIYQSCNNTLEIYERRRKDMAFVDKLIDFHLNGKELYYFTNGVPARDFTPDSKYMTTRHYRVWRGFLNYRRRNKVSRFDDNILIPIEDLHKLPRHCVVFCPQDADQASADYLKSRFSLIGSEIGTDVYEN